MSESILNHSNSTVTPPRSWLLTGIVLLLIFCVLYVYGSGLTQPADQQTGTEIDLSTAYAFSPKEAVNYTDKGIKFYHNNVHISRFNLPLKNHADYDKLKIYFTPEPGIKLFNAGHIQILFNRTTPSGEQIVADRFVKIVKPLLSYEIPLADVPFDNISILLRTNKETIDAHLYKLELLNNEPSDSLFFEWVIATLIALLLLMPGVLIVGAIAAPGPSNLIQLSYFYVGSILYFMLIFGFLETGFGLGMEDTGKFVTSIVLLSIALLFAFNYRREKFKTIRYFLAQHKLPILFFFLAFYSLAFYASQGTDYPYSNMTWQSIAGPKTFETIHSHDNYFQYANGRVLEENLPFSAEYGDKSKGERTLFYYPEDRGMLSGAMYAVFRDLLKNAYPRAGAAYLTYTVFGIAMNLLILFPLFCLISRYLRKWQLWLCMLLISVNGLFIVESMVTWFKLSGGALFLTAIYLLLCNRNKISHWLLAGLSLGLATNVHASVALGIPFYFIWLTWLRLRETKFWSFRWLSGPVALISVFILVNLPWNIIKAKYLSNSIALIATHFLGGYRAGDDLIESARLFIENTPLKEQILVRIDTLATFFRIEELSELLGLFTTRSYTDILYYWTHLEAGYTVFIYYPMAFLIVITVIYQRARKPATVPELVTSSDTGSRREYITLGLIGLASQLAYIFSTFGGQRPDVVWHQPLGLTTIVYMSMLIFLLRQGKVMRTILTIYLLLSIFRLVIANGH